MSKYVVLAVKCVQGVVVEREGKGLKKEQGVVYMRNLTE